MVEINKYGARSKTETTLIWCHEVMILTLTIGLVGFALNVVANHENDSRLSQHVEQNNLLSSTAPGGQEALIRK